MSVTSVNAYSQVSSAYTGYAASTAAAAEQKDAAAQEEQAAVYEKSDSEQQTSKTYKTDAKLIKQLKSELEQRQYQLRDMVVKMLMNQGLTIDDVLGGASYEVDEETRLAAEEAIGENGYWGVEQTSQRIVDFAMALTGGDKALAGKMRDAIEKGFELATKDWGGELPEICKKTYEKVMQALDAWENGE